jgi:hypothetical protein
VIQVFHLMNPEREKRNRRAGPGREKIASMP